MKCSLCGNLIEETDRFCERCGYPNKNAFTAISQAQGEKSVKEARNNKFCGKCGKPLSNDAMFCTFCGSATVNPKEALQQSVKQPQQAAVPAPKPLPAAKPAPAFQNVPSAANHKEYRQLGGFLQFIVIMYKIIGPAMLGIMMLTSGLPVIQSILFIKQYSTYGFYNLYSSSIMWAMIAWIFSIIFGIFGCVVCVKFAKKIEKRDSGFLHFFQLLYLIVTAVLVVLSFVSGSNTVQGIVKMVFFLIIQAVSFACWNTYFVKSVRVCVYMGSDAYLRKSIFNKKAKAPARFEQAAREPAQAQAQQNQAPVSAQLQPQAPEKPQQNRQRGALLRCEKCGQMIETYPCRFCGNTPRRRQAQLREEVTIQW